MGSRRGKRKPHRFIVKKLVYIFIILGVLFLVLDAGLRLLCRSNSESHRCGTGHLAHLLVSKNHQGGFPFEEIGIWEFDPETGFRHRPSSSGIHRTGHFSVTYTIDADGYREIPAPKNPACSVLVLGGSFTFGHGVEDDETYAAILAETLWPSCRVRNGAVSATGTGYALLKLKAAMNGADPPGLVLYGFITDHLARNYIRREWVAGIEHFGMGHPWFEIERGSLAYRGLVPFEECRPADDGLMRREREITLLLLQEMDRVCREHNARFAVVVLPFMLEASQAAFVDRIKHLGLTVLDLSAQSIDMVAELDRHPSARGHRQIAELITTSFIGDLRTAP